MPEIKVPYVNFPAQYAEEEADLRACFEEVFSQGDFVGGAAIEALEDAVAGFCGTGHAVALNCGTDALILAMRAYGIGPGDEVITPPNSFIASAGAINEVGAKPVFVDVVADQSIDPVAIPAAITPRTRAILPVHLTGRVADMNPIMELAERHGLKVIEDAAQSFGSKYDGRVAGAIGHAGCFSAHPLKNLNAAGDAGILVTDDEDLAQRVRRLANHGLIDRDRSVEFGRVSRMDTLQAQILLMRLKNLPSVIERRRNNVEIYRALLDPDHVFAPPCRDIEFNTFHTFVVQVDRRDDLKAALTEAGIGSAIHYPIPIHLQKAAVDLGHKKGDFPVTERQANRILSLPIHQFLSADDIAYVAETINRFYGSGREQRSAP